MNPNYNEESTLNTPIFLGMLDMLWNILTSTRKSLRGGGVGLEIASSSSRRVLLTLRSSLFMHLFSYCSDFIFLSLWWTKFILPIKKKKRKELSCPMYKGFTFKPFRRSFLSRIRIFRSWDVDNYGTIQPYSLSFPHPLRIRNNCRSRTVNVYPNRVQISYLCFLFSSLLFSIVVFHHYHYQLTQLIYPLLFLNPGRCTN